MVYQFPHEIAYLPRTKLGYINLPHLLSDGKRDRAARVPGYVAIHLGDFCYLIFIRDGDPFHAARLGPHSRGALPIAEVVRLVSTEIEHGETGWIGYYGAEEAQLRVMLATLLLPPRNAVPEAQQQPDRFFLSLREQRFSGVMELCDDRGYHYLCFDGGGFSNGYFCARDREATVGEFVRTLFTAAAGELRIGLYDALPQLPTQAHPALVDLYRSVVQAVVREIADRAGTDVAADRLKHGYANAAAAHSALEGLQVLEDGTVVGDTVATAEDLTRGAAAWVTDLLEQSAGATGLDPAETLKRVAWDGRFVLAQHGFFEQLPWAIAI